MASMQAANSDSGGHHSTERAPHEAGAGHQLQDKHDTNSSEWQSRSGPLGIHTHHPYEYAKRRRSSHRRSSVYRESARREPSTARQHEQTGRKWWRFHLREWNDDDEQDWWFASIAIPLIAAAIGPLANVFSVAALVTSWRMCLVTGIDDSGAARACRYSGGSTTLGSRLDGHDFADPRWCYNLDVVSLIVGFVGNFFLLCNFTNRVRYIIALPVTIICWYIATGILLGITVAMELHEPPVRPQQTYTQGFWYAVIAACMYMMCAMLLMVNMLGYWLGHYPQHFALTESQRTLILQTMLFFIWLAGGAAVFSRVEGTYGDHSLGFEWSYVNSLYCCDVTILTVGFGDLYPSSNIGRGLVFPYSVGGIIMLGLVVSSITKFAAELGSENVIKRHVERTRVHTMGRTVTTSIEMERQKTSADGPPPVISAPFDAVDLPKHKKIGFAHTDHETEHPSQSKSTGTLGGVQKVGSILLSPQRLRTRKPRLLLLREEKDRFDAMRRIQNSTSRFKNWYALFLSITAFALYFCYVCLLTIGYGDLAPKSNAGRPFFVVWSLVAVPTMTILVSDLGETVINKFKHGASGLADFTVLPQKGAYRSFLSKHPWLLGWLQQRRDRKQERKRLEDGFPTGPEPDKDEPPTIDELAKDHVPTDQDLAQKLAKVIRKTASDVKQSARKRYTYEEWVELTQLIRFTTGSEESKAEEADEGLVEWDWIGEDSPMMATQSEAEFVLDRLCESMSRYVKRVSNANVDRNGDNSVHSRDHGEAPGPCGEQPAG